MIYTVAIAALFFAACGIALIVKRQAAADVQAALAGGTIVPGCAVAEGILVILLGVLIVVAWLRGWV